MDDLDLAKMAGLSTTGVAILLIVYRVLKTVKGKTFVSKCCGRKVDFSVDVKDAEATPKETVNPMICPEKQKQSLEQV
jgi:hypothetical protein